jgi:hypothetical protein
MVEIAPLAIQICQKSRRGCKDLIDKAGISEGHGRKQTKISRCGSPPARSFAEIGSSVRD